MRLPYQRVPSSRIVAFGCDGYRFSGWRDAIAVVGLDGSHFYFGGFVVVDRLPAVGVPHSFSWMQMRAG